LPALRERKVDIPLLARHFAAKYSAGLWRTPKEISKATMQKLVSYEWPGNVRELENTIERAVLLCEHPIITNNDVCLPIPDQPSEETSFKALKAQAIAQFESEFIQQALTANDGNISKAARSAQKNRRAFWQLMRKYGIAAAALHSRGAGQTAARARTFLS
jgi:DNA-binding NtrC family response regulator